MHRYYNDNLNLINEIYKRKPLWDIKCEEKNNSSLKNTLWEEVTIALNTELRIVKKRWRYLKDTYRKELKKHLRRANADCSVAEKPTKWAYFEKLNFLRRGVMDTLDINVMKSEEYDSNDNNYDYANVKQENDADYITTDTDNSMNNDFDHSSSTIKEAEINDNYHGTRSTTPRSNPQNEDQHLQGDADYNFLISFLPYMKKMSDLENLRFRMEMSKVVMVIKEAEIANLDSSAPNKRKKTC